MRKICSKCKIEKELSFFRTDIRYAFGVRGQCKKCEKESWRERYYSVPKTERRRRQRIEAKKYALTKKAYYKKNREKILKRISEYTKINRPKISRYQKKYWKKEINRKRKYKILKERLKTDSHFKFVFFARSYVRNYLNKRKIKKTDKFINLLGCSIKYFQKHIEKQFKPGMTWQNYGFYGWHIDHIIPCAAFDLTKEEDQRKCFHYTNLQPLWWKDNLKKSANIIIPKRD